jgi:alpha-aminoadipate carrier protein LysW
MRTKQNNDRPAGRFFVVRGISCITSTCLSRKSSPRSRTNHLDSCAAFHLPIKRSPEAAAIQMKKLDGGFCLRDELRRPVEMTICPECEADLTLPNGVMENELIACPECGAELEVISLNPVELALAPEVEEDWGE